MIRPAFRLFGALALAVAGAMATPAAAKPTVSDARIGDHGSHTRFVIEVSADVTPNIFTLPNDYGPYYRVVIDLPEVDWRAPGGDSFAGRGVIAQVRHALNRPGHSRIVLDMAEPARIAQMQVLAAVEGFGHRYIIDLEPTDHDTFMQTAGWPHARELRGRTAAPPAQDRVARRIASPRERIIVIDPGHGGKDPGAIGPGGTREKDVVLDVAKLVRDQLREAGFTVYLTREDDRFLRLDQRVAFARQKKANLFISLHADSLPSKPAIRGSAVYTLSETASDQWAARLAEQENAVDGLDQSAVEDEVLRILIELAQRDTKNNSAIFAQTLLPKLSARNINLLGNTHRFAGFRVLTAPEVPSVLIELGFLSNAQDEKLLISSTWQRRMAAGIADAVESYFANQIAYQD
jgi:N-acetylmuramoyl-L-alanine amidase